MIVNTHVTEDVLVIECEGRLDALVVPSFKKKLIELIHEGNHFILIDFNAIELIDSSGLGAMVSLLKLVNSKGGEIKVFGLNDAVQSVLELTRYHLLFDILSNREQGIKKMKAVQKEGVESSHKKGETSVL
ncbi:MAG: STAS domain-containing protein [Calditrichia bacterium]